MSLHKQRKLESLFAIDSYETSEEGAPYDTVKVTDKKTGKKTNLIKDDPIYEGEEEEPHIKDKENICIDFDGVIHKYSSWNNGQLNSEAIPGAKEAIDYLKNKFKIIIFSTRASKRYNQSPSSDELVKEMKKWLDARDIYYDDITGEKLGAIAYIDDRAIRFEENWKPIIKMVDKLHNN